LCLGESREGHLPLTISGSALHKDHANADCAFQLARFPLALPRFVSLLLSDGVLNPIKIFAIDEFINAICFRESVNCFLFVFPYPPCKITGHANVKRTVAF
jgi:hypothetical protein